MKFLKTLFAKNYYIVFSTDKSNWCWRVLTKENFYPLAKVINNMVADLETKGHKNVALIKIERL